MARRGGDFGVEIDNFTINYDKIRERMNNIRNGGSKGMEGWLRGMEHVDVYAGHAQFEDAHHVRVGNQILRGDIIVIHTGTRTRRNPLPGLDDVDWISNEGLLDLEAVPKHLIVVGGSYIGMEFAQIFRRFGAEVTILEAAPT